MASALPAKSNMRSSLLFDVKENEPRVMKWRKITERHSLPPAMKNHTATLFRNELIIFGGFDGTANNSKIHVMNTDTFEWRVIERVEGIPPAGRNGHTATLANGKIYYIGGWLGSGPLGSNEIYTLDPITWTWTRVTTTGPGPGPCNMHTADYIERAPDDRCIFVFRGGDGSSYLNDLHLLDVDRHVWRKPVTKGTPPLPRANHSSAVIGKNLFIFGGWDGQNRLQDVYVLDAVTLEWSCPDMNGPAPIPRAGSSFTAVDDGIVLFGGSGPHSSCFNDVRILNPKTMTWYKAEKEYPSLTGESNTNWSGKGDDSHQHDITYRIYGEFPEHRAGHTATLIKNRRLLVVGGSFQADYLTSVYELDLDPPPDLLLLERPPALKLLDGLKGFFNNPELSDVVLKVENERIFCHRIVLCTQSEWFRVLFQGGFQESNVKEVTVSDVSADVFMQLIEFMYKGSVDVLEGLVEEEVVLTKHNQASAPWTTQHYQHQSGEPDYRNWASNSGDYLQPFSSDSATQAQESMIDAICNLMLVADQFLCTHLRERCEIALAKLVQESTVKSLFVFAEANNANILLRRCEHFERWGYF